MRGKACAPGADGDQGANLLGPDTFTLEPRAEILVGQGLALHLPDASEDLRLALGEVVVQPGAEDVLHAKGQADDGAADEGRSRIEGCLHNGRDLFIINGGNDWGEGDADGHACGAELANGIQALGWTAGAGFQLVRELGAKGGDADVGGGCFVAGEVLEQIEVSGDQMVLGDEHHGIPALGHDLQASPCHLELLFDRLVGICDARAGEAHWLVAGSGEFCPEQAGGFGFDHDLAFKIIAG